jgi:outer membrane protein assembly factor BamB
MHKLPRLCLVAAAVGLLAVVPAVVPGQEKKDAPIPPPAPRQAAPAQVKVAQPPGIGQPNQPPNKQPDFTPGQRFSAIKLVENEEYQKAIDQAIDAIEGGDWPGACGDLQAILDSKEDVYARVDTHDPMTGQQKTRYISVKFEANRLLSKMPADGLNTYEVKFGAQARQLLDQAKKTGNRDLLGEVASRLLHTKAGGEANELLATSCLDRGEYFQAALRYAMVIGPDPAQSRASDLTLLKAALASKQAGDLARAGQLWDALYARIKSAGSLALANGQAASLKQIQAFYDQIHRAADTSPLDWPLVGGNVARNAQAKGSPPMLDYPLWSRPTFMDVSEFSGDVESGAEVKDLFEKVLKTNLSDPQNPVMPGGYPIAANGLLFYRSYEGITALYLHDVLDKEGKIEAKAGSLQSKSTQLAGSLAFSFTNRDRANTLQRWVEDTYMKSGISNLLYENSTVGTLSTDSRNIYAVDDLALPIPPKYLMQQFWGQPNLVQENVKTMVLQNVLCAFDLATGANKWNLGVPPDDKAVSKSESPKANDYEKTHFLCVPINVGGKLYVLNEKNNGDLRLLCLDPENKGERIGPPQLLGTVKNEHRYFHDMARRANAIHLAYAEGILVCPTNAGEILGVDLLTRSLAWAYKYREKPPAQGSMPKQFEPKPDGATVLSYSNWRASPPVIVDGKVVFTAPDSSGVHCINLRDGTEVWAAPRNESDLYLAGVFLDKVLIVGKHSVRALRLADGAPAWPALQTGDVPSGHGVASNNVYYLPLRRREILAIDLARWGIKAHNRASSSDAEPPGNLLFYQGMVISQTPTRIVAYPQLEAKLAEAEAAYAKDPSIGNLLFRGELRLADGQLQKAVDDLSMVLAKDPSAEAAPKAKAKLFDALGDLLRSQFKESAGKYLEKYKELCAVPGNAAEEVERTAQYWRILAEGRQQEGDLVSAFVAFKEYGASPKFKDKGIPDLDDPAHTVPANLWLRARIGAMFESASPAQRRGLEAKIAEQWKAVQQTKDVKAIRDFAGMFDVPFAVGRQARLELADSILSAGTRDEFLEAELSLMQLRAPAFKADPAVGGKALETLARLELAKGGDDPLRLAAAYYREIKHDFPNAIFTGGKTGAELFQTLAEDPRLRPYLEESAVSWGPGKVAQRKLANQIEPAGQRFVFQPDPELPPHFQQLRLVLDYADISNPQLQLVSVRDQKARWKTGLGPLGLNNIVLQNMYNPMNPRQAYHAEAGFRFFSAKGHLAVLQVGITACGVDLDTGKVLWRQTLYDPTKVPNAVGTWQVMADERGGLWALHNTPNGQAKSRIGRVGAVQPTYVALVTHKGLMVIDPLDGSALWSKSGMANNIEIFGDDQHIYYVETAEGMAVGAGRCLRASDGAPVEVRDFGFYYRHQQRIVGGAQILTAEPNGKALTMRLYDVLTGKDLWKRTFENDPAVLSTLDLSYCGVVERATGKLIVVDLRTFKEVLQASLKEWRVGIDDLASLDRPLLLDDGELFYVALNGRNQVPATAAMGANFTNGIRCLPVNGWICAIDRKGQFLWHSFARMTNQMIVADQFKSQPLLLFTSRALVQDAKTQVYSPIAQTVSFDKSTGMAIWSDRHASNAAQYTDFRIDWQAGAVDLVGPAGIVQHYIKAEEK